MLYDNLCLGRHMKQTFHLFTFAVRNTNFMKRNLFIILALVAIVALPSCVSKKKFIDLQGQKSQTDLALEEAMQRIKDLQNGRTADNERLNSTLRNKEAELAREKARAETLAEQMGALNTTNHQRCRSKVYPSFLRKDQQAVWSN